tara:strand:- start:2012 stop:2788 length:777 start_codon:yes stop_codon:yes gene_type:complete
METPTQRRNRLRSKRKLDNLILIWKIIFFNSITFFLSIVIIKNGWQPIERSNIEIKGSSLIDLDTILDISTLKLPEKLFNIDPGKLKFELLRELPIKNASINRRIIPASLSIEIQERKPIAKAQRTGPFGEEMGMIDKEAYWIPTKYAKKSPTDQNLVFVSGWRNGHRSQISQILSFQSQLGTTLEKIDIRPNGDILIQTDKFKFVELGQNLDELKNQIRALKQLSKKLPENYVKQKNGVLDLRDPTKPELQIENSQK